MSSSVGKRVVPFISKYDGSEHYYLQDVPPSYTGNPMPLVISPHPCTWSAEADYENGPAEAIAPHPGWKGLPEKYGFILVAPFGHARTTGELTCLGYEGQIADMGQVIDEVKGLGFRIDESRIYACGLSMGGQEVLLFTAKFNNRVAAAFTFNPVVDLKTFYEDILQWDDPNISSLGIIIEQEVGGKPADVLSEYEKRSPLSYANELSQVPLMLWWSDMDAVVPRGLTHHSKKLYDLIKTIKPKAPVAEYNHTISHAIGNFDLSHRIYVHEYSNYEFAVQWLLLHRKKLV
ncbi:prolyl oligopeptidase family protein [Peptococcaceae bacterium CEB3]|nr:prolyl oligopeptidase family protein [Peptococcaceae bacterium CEB3]